MFPNQEDLKKVSCEYEAFSIESNFFNQPHVVEARSYKEPLSWWAIYGSPTPLLQALAFKLLAQPTYSSCCERNWSTYYSFHQKKQVDNKKIWYLYILIFVCYQGRERIIQRDLQNIGILVSQFILTKFFFII